MKFEFQYSSRAKEIFSKIKLFIAWLIIDVAFTLIIDAVLFIPITLIIDKIYTLFTKQIEVPSTFSTPILILLGVAELTVIIIVECKRRNTYVELNYSGVCIHNNNGMRFQPKQWYKINAAIPFYDVTDCYSLTPKNVPKNYLYQYIAPIKSTVHNMGLSNNPYYLPAIANGRYDEKCVLLELKNGKTVVLPIDDCDEFIELFNSYSEKYLKQ